ncbi:MAG: hypothetical protein V4864_08310 [Pseudomonadota bacterium]
MRTQLPARPQEAAPAAALAARGVQDAGDRLAQSPLMVAQRARLLASFGASAVQRLGEDGDAEDGEAPATTREKVESDLARAQVLLEEVAEDRLEENARANDRHYLANRMEGLRAEMQEIFRDYAARRDHGERWLTRMLRRIRRRDLLPLLESTVDEMKAVPWSVVAENGLVLPHDGTLLEKLEDLFAQAEENGAYGIPFALLRDWVSDADETECAAVAADADLLARMRDHLRRGEYPMFRYYLGVHDAPRAAAAPHGDVDERAPEIDTEIEDELGAYVFAAAARGLTLEHRVLVLGGDDWHAAVRAYFPNQGASDRESISGFTQNGVVYLNADKGDAGTLIHEGIHQHAPDDFVGAFGNKLNEGVTEYFARKVCARLGIPRKSYADEVSVATAFIAKVGEPLVASAYFQGLVGTLTDALQARWNRAGSLEDTAAKLRRLRGMIDLEWDAQQALLTALGIGK